MRCGVAALVRPVTGDITFTLFLAAATWFVGDSVRTRRIYQASLVEQAEERQRQEMDRAERAVVEERLEIARELHDVIAHSLSVIAIQSGVGRHVIDTQPDEAGPRSKPWSRPAAPPSTSSDGSSACFASDGRPELAPAPTLADSDELVDRVRDAGVPIELAMRRHHAGASPGSRALRLPHRPGGTDQRGEARRIGADPGVHPVRSATP